MKDLCIEVSDISDNTIHALGNSFQNIPNLTDLHLPSNQITDNRLMILCEYFTNLNNLSYLDLNYNCLTYDVLNRSANYFSYLTKLNTLMLCNIEIQNINIDGFIECISNLSHFDYIDMNSIFVYYYN